MSTPHLPNPFEFRFITVFEVGPHLQELAGRLLDTLESTDMTADELRAYADSKTQEIVDSLTATITAERDEVMAAISAQGGGGGTSDADVRAALDAQQAAIRDRLVPLIQGIFDPATSGGTGGTAPTPTPPPAPPTPTGGVTPTDPNAPTIPPGNTPPGAPGTGPQNPVTVTTPDAGQPPQTTVTPAPGEGVPVPSSAAR